MKTKKVNGVVYLYLEGMLTTDSSITLKNELDDVVGHGETNLVLNMKDLQLITSAGLRVLLACAKNLQKLRGRVILQEMPEDVLKVFRMTGFDQIFTICGESEHIEENIAA